MKTAKAKIKAKQLAAVNCSPLRRRVASMPGQSKFKSSSDLLFPRIAMTFKSSGVRRIISQYSEMETEVMSLKRRYIETKQRYKALRTMMKENRMKSRQLMVQCALKLQEKEVEIEEIQKTKSEDLSRIGRELTHLRANLMKEQKRLCLHMKARDETISRQAKEIALLKARNEELERFAAKAAEVDRDMDTPSSIESDSPNSSFSVPKFVIKPKEMDAPPIATPPALPRPPSSSRRVRFQSADEAFLVTPRVEPLRKAFQAHPNKDSGRETDSSEHSDKVSPNREAKPSQILSESTNLPQPSRFSQFIRESGLDQKSIVSPSWMLTNHKEHRKPSDVKSRAKFRSVVSDLTVLEEHQLNGNGKVTKVMYWSEPSYL
eukprot:maker-scaffold1125_size61249-snap-gene-0.15 protein:Tk00355 transcript:maker-scaffold1125_size61249-snap-gene-0.15-mRNA-1 annotation:"PREDICTED: hypothetical protein LOC100748446"